MKAAACILLLILGRPSVTTHETQQPTPRTFLGTWVNTDPQTGGLTRLAVGETERGWTINAWGSCRPVECEWGTVPLHRVGSSVSDQTFDRTFATWTPPHATTHVILLMNGEQLSVETITIFKDMSGRSNYRSLYVMRRSP